MTDEDYTNVRWICTPTDVELVKRGYFILLANFDNPNMRWICTELFRSGHFKLLTNLDFSKNGGFVPSDGDILHGLINLDYTNARWIYPSLDMELVKRRYFTQMTCLDYTNLQ